jgi:hypothetical protein
MFDERDVDGRSGEQGAREHGDEFSNLARRNSLLSSPGCK